MQAVILSLKQPWAELVVSARKTIELRTWNTKHRGVFYIHASINVNKNKCEELKIEPESLTKGAVIGKAELVKVIRYEHREELVKDASKHYAPDYKLPCYGFILAEAERIKPKRMKGRLNFWKQEL